MSPDAAAPVERLLIAMGFRHAGQHRTKPVQLWRHGDTRILVNHDGEEHPRVAAIAVESEDPIRSADRAQHLLAPLLPRERGPGEAALSAIAAPDGTSVFFCRTDGDGWLTDFLTAGPPGGGVSPDVTGIDHVALSQPFDFFDEAVLFYRSVLGLELQTADELATAGRARAQPRGPERRRQRPLRAQRPGGRRRRLRVPARRARQRRRPRGSGGDARPRRPAARDPRQLLRRPARAHGLDPETVERMRELGVLYDATADGELLHVYTEMVGPGLCFEIVERSGAYDGYGAANSPVRVAAQQPVTVIGS